MLSILLSSVLALPLAGDEQAFADFKHQDIMPSGAAFKVGEYLKYRVHYGILDAGYAELRVSREAEKYGHETYHVIGTGWSTGMFNWFFKVKDRYESYIDQKHLVPHYFIRDVYEGGYEINRDISFNHNTNKAYTENKEFDVPVGVQDLLSSFYYARSLDVSGMQPGDYFDIPLFLDMENYTMRMKYLGLETINSDVGKFECMKFRPMVQVGNVFRDEEALSLWVTNDDNHVPIRAQADVLVGSIKMDLIEYRNTKTKLNPL